MNQFNADQESPSTRDNQHCIKLVNSKMDDDPSAKDHEASVDLVQIKEEEDSSCSGSSEWVKIEVIEAPPVMDHEDSMCLMKDGGQMLLNMAHQESMNSIKVEEEAEVPGIEPQHIITFSWAENERTPFVLETQESVEDGIVGSSATEAHGSISSTGSMQRNRRRWNHWKNKRASTEDGQGPCTELKYNIMSQSTGTTQWFKKQVCQKSRASRHSEESTLIIVDSVLKFYSLLIGKKASSTSSERKKQIWQYIANKVNATSSVTRTWEQVRKRYYDVKKSIRLKHMQAKQDAKKTSKPVSVQLTPAEQRVANTMNLSSMRVLEGWDSGDMDGSIDGDFELPFVEEKLQPPEPVIPDIVKVEEEEQELQNPDLALQPSYLELDTIAAMEIPLDLQEHNTISNDQTADDHVGGNDDTGGLVAAPQETACNAIASAPLISSITPETSGSAFITPTFHVSRKPKRKRLQPTVSNATVNPPGAAQAALLEHTKLLECTVRQCESVERICSAIELQRSHEEECERARRDNHRTLCDKVDRLANSIDAVGTSITSAVQQNAQALQEMAKTNQGLLQVFAQTNLILSKISDTLASRARESSPLPAALRPSVEQSPATPSSPHPEICTPAPECSSGSWGSGRRGRKGAGAANLKKKK